MNEIRNVALIEISVIHLDIFKTSLTPEYGNTLCNNVLNTIFIFILHATNFLLHCSFYNAYPHELKKYQSEEESRCSR